MLTFGFSSFLTRGLTSSGSTPCTSTPTPATLTGSAPCTSTPLTNAPTPPPATPPPVTPSPPTPPPATPSPATPPPATPPPATPPPATLPPATPPPPTLAPSTPAPSTNPPTTSAFVRETTLTPSTTGPLANATSEIPLVFNTNSTSVNTSTAGSSSSILSKTPAPSTGSTSATGLIAGVACGAVTLLLIIILIVWKRKRKNVASDNYESHISPRGYEMTYTRKSQKTELVATTTNSTNRASPREPQDWEFVNLDCLRMLRLEPVDLVVSGDKPISFGAFGEVWMGEYIRERVAIKRIKDKSVNSIRRFRNEINLMAKIESPYIVTLVGASWRRPTDLECVVEYMDRGDLRTILETTNQVEFPWEEKLSSIIAIVRGCIYLHTFEPQIIHRDLKSRNVLLDSKKGTKITDFGEAREMDDRTLTNGIGTYQWMAPEVLIGNNYTTAADVYSFGVILSEFSTHSVPYSNMVNPKNNKPFSHQYILTQVGFSSLKPSFDTENTPEWLLDLAEQCLAHDPDQRPSMMQVNSILSRI